MCYTSVCVQHPVRFIDVSDGLSLLGSDTSERLDLVRRVYNVGMCVTLKSKHIELFSVSR